MSRLLDGLARRRASADRRRPAPLGRTPTTACSSTLLQRHTRRTVCDPDDKTPLERRPRLRRAARLPPARRGRPLRAVDRRAGAVRAAVDRRALRVRRRRLRRARASASSSRARTTDGAAGPRDDQGAAAASRSCRTRRPRSGATMPDAAIAATVADAVLPLDEIPAVPLRALCGGAASRPGTRANLLLVDDRRGEPARARGDPRAARPRLVSVTSGDGGAARSCCSTTSRASCSTSRCRTSTASRSPS